MITHPRLTITNFSTTGQHTHVTEFRDGAYRTILRELLPENIKYNKRNKAVFVVVAGNSCGAL
jgi:hypothetical protein